VASVALGSLLGCSVVDAFDPRIVYDQHASRWYVVAATRTAPASVCFGVSATDDPSGVWYMYSFPVLTGHFPDFPTLGVSNDKVAFDANVLLPPGSPGTSPGHNIWVLRIRCLGGLAVADHDSASRIHRQCGKHQVLASFSADADPGGSNISWLAGQYAGYPPPLAYGTRVVRVLNDMF
jgi:hypothetical protein